MIKNIKRVGIIFLAVAIICLMAIGCLSVNSVANNGSNVTGSSLNNEQNNISADVEDNEQKESASEEVVIPSADRVHTLSGDCDLMAEGWQKAVKESEETGSVVKVILGNNWTAKADPTYKTSFGSGYAFEKGIIVVPVGCHIVLDLAGKTIDRALTVQIRFGRLFTVDGNLDIIDSSYDMSKVYTKYDEILANATQSSWEEKRDYIVQELKEIPCGKLTGGKASSDFGSNNSTGGAIHLSSNANLNIYGGMLYNNVSNHGVISTETFSNLYIYDVVMVDNQSTMDSAGIFVCGNANIYKGLYVGNEAVNGVFYSTAGGLINIYDSIFSYNKSSTQGVLYAYSKGNIVIDNIRAVYNNATYVLSVSTNSNATINGGAITDNISSGVYLTNSGKITINGGVIARNTKFGAIVSVDNRFVVKAGTQIYDNTSGDVLLYRGAKIEVGGTLANSTKQTRVGVILDSNYLNETFTLNYTAQSNNANPSMFFFANNGKKIVLESNEAKLSTEASTATDLTWKWTGGQAVGGSNATVTYTGNPFTISASNSSNVAQSFYKQGNAKAATSFAVTNVGSYAFYSNGDYKNPTFMFKIVPKEVDITWGNETFVYNGNSQVLSAVVAGYPDCVVTVIGGQTKAGSGYMAIATALSDPNLKIRGTRQTKEFSIERAKINAPSGTQTFILDGKEHTYTPTTGWDNTKMAIVDNKATEAGVHKATIMLKDPVNYQWATGGGRHIELEYTIEDKSIIKNNVYDFIYLEQNGDSILRKTYKEGNVYRMANDSEVISNNNDNKLIIGNIAPNTTVFEFMENLKVESNQISIYNGSKAIIENGAVASGINESLLRDKNEMPIGTGWRVVVNHEDEQTEEIYLSVLGDITGDGKVNTADVNVIRQIVNDKEVFENIRIEAKLASLILNKGKLATNSDAQLLWETACGRMDLKDFI